MSRNKNRLGGGTKAEPDTSPPAALMQETSNEGFSFVVPTEFVELPSKGLLYTQNHPLHGQDSIEIKQMTAKEEDLLTSKTLLKKGIAIDRLVQSLLVDKRIKVDSLFVGDKNAIIIAIRKSGYGAEYSTKITCPNCGAVQKRTFNLNEFNTYSGQDIDKLDIINNADGTFTTELPKTKLSITFRLLTGHHEKTLVSGMKLDRQQKHHERAVTRQLKNIPSMDSRHLRLCYKLAAPDVELTQQFICEECDFDQDLEVPLTADFFWPNE